MAAIFDEDLRDHSVEVPLTAGEYERVTTLARRLGRSRANLMRRALALAEEHKAKLAKEPIPRAEQWKERGR
jgi:hypothetical protein